MGPTSSELMTKGGGILASKGSINLKVLMGPAPWSSSIEGHARAIEDIAVGLARPKGKAVTDAPTLDKTPSFPLKQKGMLIESLLCWCYLLRL